MRCSDDYKDPGTLRHLYHDKQLSTNEIGKMFDVTGDNIRYYMDKFDIERRSKFADGCTPEELVDALHDVAEVTGETPTVRTVTEHTEYSQGAFESVFDSFNTALREAGFEPNVKGTRDVTCDNCGTVFPKRVSLIERSDRDFCCKECKHEYGREQLSCDICGSDFTARESYANNGLSDFCSPECYSEHVTRRMTGNTNPTAVDETEYLCDYCGAVNYRLESQVKGRVFCNRECHRQWQLETDQNVGENHPNYNGGYGTYGYQWEVVRAEALEIVGYECQDCGMSNREHLRQTGFGLHGHHIKKALLFENSRDGHTLDNVLILCQDCHDKWEGVTDPPMETPA